MAPWQVEYTDQFEQWWDQLSMQEQAAIDVFNVMNSKNLRRPEVTNLVFNFDGTVQSGVGDPRQVQLGLRVLW